MRDHEKRLALALLEGRAQITDSSAMISGPHRMTCRYEVENYQLRLNYPTRDELLAAVVRAFDSSPEALEAAAVRLMELHAGAQRGPRPCPARSSEGHACSLEEGHEGDVHEVVTSDSMIAKWWPK